MEIDPEGFEQLTKIANNEEKTKNTRVKEVENRWAKLEQKVGTHNQ